MVARFAPLPLLVALSCYAAACADASEENASNLGSTPPGPDASLSDAASGDATKDASPSADAHDEEEDADDDGLQPSDAPEDEATEAAPEAAPDTAPPIPTVASSTRGWADIDGTRPGYEYGPASVLENGTY